MDLQNTSDSGLAGVAVLIVFIALVLVAAIAAAVILNVTGLLEQQASQTGEDSVEQLSSTLQIVDVQGEQAEFELTGAEDLGVGLVSDTYDNGTRLSDALADGESPEFKGRNVTNIVSVVDGSGTTVTGNFSVQEGDIVFDAGDILFNESVSSGTLTSPIDITYNFSDRGVDEVQYTVSAAAGADPIDLDATTITVNTDNENLLLTAEDADVTEGTPDGEFLVEPLVADDPNVIQNGQERYRIVVQFGENKESGVRDLPLEQNENVQATFTTASGGEAFHEFTIPSNLVTSDTTLDL